MAVQSPALDELHKVVLRHRGRHIATRIDRKVGAPGQGEVEAYESGMLVAEFQGPELIGK